MARFRYVKGDIIKTTKGKHRIFAKDNIEFISAKKVSIVGKEGGVVYGTPEEAPKFIDLQVVKVEGPFDENGSLVEYIEKDTYYTYKATTNRKPKPNEVKLIKWEREYDNSKEYKIIWRGGTLLDDGKIAFKFRVGTETVAERLKLYSYFNSRDNNAKIEVDIIISETIIVVGTEQHSESYGNKLMFPAQAVREVYEMEKTENQYITILIFKDGFNSKEMTTIEKDAKKLYKKLNFIKINSVNDLVKYINKGQQAVIDREKTKIKTIKIFSHGLASVLDFGLDGNNQSSQRFKISHVTQLEKRVFDEKAEIYSYACRTGNSDTRLVVSVNKNYTYDSDWLDIVKPQESLAQKLADHLDVTVYAYLTRSLYTPTWDDGGDEKYRNDYKEIDDENINGWSEPKRWFTDWDEALWNPNGAFAPPTGGYSPKGIPRDMYKYMKGKKPMKK